MQFLDISPVKPNTPTPTVGDFDRWFRHSQSLDTNLHLAAICAGASEKLSEADQQRLIECLNTGGSYCSKELFEKLVRIGQDKRLRSEGVYPFLPSSINHLDTVASLTDKQLEKAIMQGVLNPNIWLMAFQLWMKAEGIKPAKVRKTRRSRKKRLMPSMGFGRITFQPA